MTQEALERAQQVLQTLHDTLEQHATQSGPRLFAEPFLMQTLMTVTAFLPEQLESRVRVIIDEIRQHKEGYGSYVSYAPDQVRGEQIVSLHEDEAAANHGLERVGACDIAGRVAQISVSRSPFPGGQATAQPMWAVLVSSEIDRRALLRRLYPQLGARHNLGSTTLAYDQAGQSQV